MTTLQEQLLARERRRAPRNSTEALAKQGVASIMELLVPSPAAVEALPHIDIGDTKLGIGSFIPNFVFMPGALGELGVNFAAQELFGAEEPVSEASLRAVGSGVESVEELLGTGPPRTTAENIARGVPGGLIPLPVPKATGPITRGAIEVLAPGLQNPTVPGMLLSTVPGIALGEVISEEVDPEFESEFFTGDATPIADVLPPLTTEPIIADDGMEFAVVPTEDNDLSMEFALGLTGILALLSGRSALRAIEASKNKQIQEGLQELTGEVQPNDGRIAITQSAQTQGSIRGPITGRTTALETQLVDKDAPLFAGLREAGVDPDTFELFRARVVTTTSPQALSARLHDVAITGQLPNSSLRIPPLSVHLETLGRLTPEQRALYNDGLLARTRIDDMEAQNVNLWGLPSTGNVQSRADLEQIVRNAEADPVVNDLMNEANNTYHGLADYLLEAGVISPDDRAAWARLNPHYTPLQRNFEADAWLSGVFDSTEPRNAGGLKLFDARGGLDEGIMPGEAVEPMRIHEQYMARIIRNAENNRIRREFIDLAINNNLQDGNGNAIIKSVKTPTNETITIKRNGESQHYQIDDPAIRNALFFSPAHTAGILNSARRFAQEFTTGVARPDFVPVSIMYEMLSAVPMVRTGRGLGPLDEAINRLSGGVLSDAGLPDPSVVASPVTGFLKQETYATFIASMARNLDVQMKLGHGGALNILGDRNAQRLRNVLMDAYERSTARLFQQHGGGNNIFIENVMGGQIPSVVADLAPTYAREVGTDFTGQFRADSFSRRYLSMLNAMHNSIRIQSAASSIQRRGLQVISTPDEVERIMADTRALTGDISRVGGDPTTTVGRVGQKTISQSLYANHFVQVTAQNVRAMRDHPVRFWTTMSLMATGTTALLMEQFKNDPGAQTHYWNDLTVEQRGQFIPIYESGQVKGLVMIPPEHRMLWSPFIEGVGTVFGYKGGPHLMPQEIGDLQVALDTALAGEYNAHDFQDSAFGFASAVGQSILPDPIGPGLRAAEQAAFLTSEATGLGGPEIGQLPNPSIAGVRALTQQDVADVGGARFRSQSGTRAEVDQNAELVDRAKLLLDAVFASSSRMLIDTTDALVRSIDAEQSVMTSLDNASRAFFTPMREPTRATLGTSMWGIDARVSTKDGNARELQPKLEQITNVIGRANTLDVRAPATAKLEGAPSVPGLNVLQGLPAGNTELSLIGQHTISLQRWLAKAYERPIADLRLQLDAMRQSPTFADPDARRAEENRIHSRIKSVNAMALGQVKAVERAISNALGREFTYEGVDLDAVTAAPVPQ